jgi:hypothetical protein
VNSTLSRFGNIATVVWQVDALAIVVVNDLTRMEAETLRFSERFSMASLTIDFVRLMAI